MSISLHNGQSFPVCLSVMECGGCAFSEDALERKPQSQPLIVVHEVVVWKDAISVESESHVVGASGSWATAMIFSAAYDCQCRHWTDHVVSECVTISTDADDACTALLLECWRYHFGVRRRKQQCESEPVFIASVAANRCPEWI